MTINQQQNQQQQQQHFENNNSNNSITTALEDLNEFDLMNRREIRSKHLIDQVEILEEGFDEKERLISNNDKSNNDNGNDSDDVNLSSRDKRALALLIALCKLIFKFNLVSEFVVHF